MSNYIDDNLDWEDEEELWEEEEELLEDDEDLEEEGVVEYEYGIDEWHLKNIMAPKKVESPAEFSKTPIIKLQDLQKDYEGLTIGLATPTQSGAQFFYTIKYWWIGKDPKTQKTTKKLVVWEVRGPTSAYYIKIPSEQIIGIYRNKGYHITSDIFVEYRIDEKQKNWLGVEWVERRDAHAMWTKPNESVEKEFKKIQEGKPSDIAGSQPLPQDQGFLGLGGLFQSINKTLLLLIILAIIVGGIYFTAKSGLLDLLKSKK
jgi:hypothetical protein